MDSQVVKLPENECIPEQLLKIGFSYANALSKLRAYVLAESQKRNPRYAPNMPLSREEQPAL